MPSIQEIALGMNHSPEAVYARDSNGKVLKFASDHEARLFGTTPLGRVSELGPGGQSGIQRPTMTNLLDDSGNLKGQYQLQARPNVSLDVNQDALKEFDFYNF